MWPDSAFFNKFMYISSLFAKLPAGYEIDSVLIVQCLAKIYHIGMDISAPLFPMTGIALLSTDINCYD